MPKDKTPEQVYDELVKQGLYEEAIGNNLNFRMFGNECKVIS